MNYNHIIVYDFETGDKNPETAEILSIGAVHIDPRRLTVGETFYSLCKPLKPEEIQKEALDVNKLLLEDLNNAPHPSHVWKDFADFAFKFNPKKSSYFAPISAGFNIIGYDSIILNRYSKEYNTIENKSGKQCLFSNYIQLDLMTIIWSWMENVPKETIPNLKFDTLRDYFGIDKTNSHNALKDAIDEANLLIKFLRLYRSQFSNIKFAGALSGVKYEHKSKELK